MAKTPEGDVVEYAKTRLKRKGCLCRKISYEMRRGCPDMLVLVPPRLTYRKTGYKCLETRSDVIFIEYKRDENTEPEPHQLREHERMIACGADVRVIGTRQQVDDLVQELFPE